MNKRFVKKTITTLRKIHNKYPISYNKTTKRDLYYEWRFMAYNIKRLDDLADWYLSNWNSETIKSEYYRIEYTKLLEKLDEYYTTMMRSE